MKDFKCINCGKTAESEEGCACSLCGYKMYEAPYERAQLLLSEVKSYLLSRIDYDFKVKWVSIYRKEKDKKIPFSDDIERFPEFSKIYDYTTKVSKTEDFLERLKQSVSHLKKHCSESFSNDYTVDTSSVEFELQRMDEHISSAFEPLPLDFNANKTEIADFSMEYSEVPNAELSENIKILIEETEKLHDKLSGFIKANRLFGAFFKNTAMPEMKIKDDADHVKLLKKQISKTQKILGKKYIIDILSDGADEVGEMLDCLWEGICLVMSLPILSSERVYIIENSKLVGDDELKNYLKKYITERYAPLSDEIRSDAFLSDMSEKQLFEIYDSLIKLDKTGYFGLNAENLSAVGKNEEKLNELIGLEPIKKSIKKIKAYSLSNKDSGNLNLHMCFYGNPGTGKTEVARIIAGILHENGILPKDKVVEVDRSGLIAEYVGQTAPKTMEAVESAMGGVLFIDEAYSLAENGGHDYGKEAIATLIKAMEDYRGKFCVILAGYKNQMIDMIKVNPGFESRIQFTLDFPNYSRDELRQIAKIMLSKSKYHAGETALEKMLDITDIRRKSENFANARDMRNIIEQVIMCQNVRTFDPENRAIELVDVNHYIKDANISLPTADTTPKSKVLSGEEELEQLVGLDTVKRMVRKIKAYAKRNHNTGDFNMNMCFTGNPGTGKTEVARILSRILYDAGVLSEAKLIETDSSGLIGKYVGETAPKTIAKVRDALGGVLFIDEAYALADASGEKSGYGDEAIAALIKEMEDKRGQVCVILAGYQDKMKQMIASNAGFASRIQFTLSFPDYTSEELREIAEKFLYKKGYKADSDAMETVMEIAEHFRKQPDFANARTIRNILEQVIMNQNLRTEDKEENSEIILSDVEDYVLDEGIDFSSGSVKGKIGF